MADFPCTELKVLDHLAVDPAYKRRGDGKMLMWAFEKADKEGVACYLESELDGEGLKLYEKLGFFKVDEVSVDLETLGLPAGIYTHIGMVREPKTAAAAAA